MGEVISIRVGNEIERELIKIERKLMVERSEIVRRLLTEAIKQWKLQNAIKELSEHRISLGKAAKMADISIWDMIDMAKEKNIDWVDYTKEDLIEDLKIIKKLKH